MGAPPSKMATLIDAALSLRSHNIFCIGGKIMQNQFTTLSAILEVIWARRHELGLMDTSLACSAIETSSGCEDVDTLMCSIEDALCDAHECIPSSIEEWDCPCVEPWVDESLREGICDCDAVPNEYANVDPNPVIDEMRLLDVLDSLDHLRAEIDAAFDAVENHLRYLCS